MIKEFRKLTSLIIVSGLWTTSFVIANKVIEEKNNDVSNTYKRAEALTSDGWDGTTAASSYASGSGTEGSPYVISNASQLYLLECEVYGYGKSGYSGYYAPGKYFELSNDIDLNNHYICIGGYARTDRHTGSTFFQGYFDGNNHTVNNYYLNSPGAQNIALFGNAKNATIEYLTVRGTMIGGDRMAGVLRTAGSNTTLRYCDSYVDIVALFKFNEKEKKCYFNYFSPKYDASWLIQNQFEFSFAEWQDGVNAQY